MTFFKKWWPALIPALIAAWHTALPTVQHFTATHPKAAVWYGIIAMFVTTLLKSPLVQAEEASLKQNMGGKLVPVLILALFLPFGAKAQTNVAPPPSPQYFVISVSAAGYNGQKGAQPLTIVGAALQVTKNLSVGYNQYFNPADTTQPYFRMGVANYTRELAEICSYCKTHFVFDTTNILVTGQVGFGRVTYTLPSATSPTSHIAETVGAFVSIPMSSHISFQLVGWQILHGAGTTTLTRNTTQQISAGPYFTF
jgi:hypothetical protein